MATIFAESLPQGFFEWREKHDGTNDVLLDCILIWLYEEAAIATCGDRELYLKTVAVIIHEWHTSAWRQKEMPEFDSTTHGWRCIEKETYCRASQPSDFGVDLGRCILFVLPLPGRAIFRA